MNQKMNVRVSIVMAIVMMLSLVAITPRVAKAAGELTISGGSEQNSEGYEPFIRISEYFGDSSSACTVTLQKNSDGQWVDDGSVKLTSISSNMKIGKNAFPNLAFGVEYQIVVTIGTNTYTSNSVTIADPADTSNPSATPYDDSNSSDIHVKKVTKNSVVFGETAAGVLKWYKSGTSDISEKDFPNGNPKATGLKAATKYVFKYCEYEMDGGEKVTTYESKWTTVTTAESSAPKIKSIKITNAKNHEYGYRDILGVWHKTGTAATGKITVTFKKAPKVKYAVIYNTNGVHCVKIKGKKAVVASQQFQRGSKKGGTTKVWVATASAMDQNTMQTGLSPKTKKKTVRIG